MKTFLKIVGVIVILVGGLIIYIELNFRQKYNDTPYPNIKASTDTSVIARGKYIVYGPGHCAVCHVGVGEDRIVDAGKELPLAGGFEIHIPPGTFRPSNLTSDKETGIGGLADKEIARTLRYGVNHNGEAVFPFMPYQNMSVPDMIAVISYLRTQSPVHHVVLPTEYSFLGKIVKAFALKPIPPADPAPAGLTKDSSVEYGHYLATCVANCYGCHTNRDVKSFKFIGAPFAGGFSFPPAIENGNFGFVSPNLTPDKETGVIAEWPEETFISRMHAGRRVQGSPMPWGPFSRLDNTDLKAIYRYLQTVAPVKKTIAKTVFKPGEPVDEYKD